MEKKNWDRVEELKQKHKDGSDVEVLLSHIEELEDALKGMVLLITSGGHYTSMNPYTRPAVQKAIKLLARLQGKSDYLDVDLK